MTTTLFAQPYDFSAEGFYFKTIEAYREQAGGVINAYGDPVEEFELQFIDGEAIDCALAQAWQPNQANIADFIDAVENWDIERKRHYIVAVGECGYSHVDAWRVPHSIEIDLYAVDSLQELAEQFVDDGLYGEIPESLRGYIDYEAIARDLGMEFTETEIAGERLVYACR